MGLFDKKTCVICGKQFGLLGGTSLADGHLCSDCRRKLSPYTYGVKKMTAEDVKKHLAYREKNQVNLSSFNPTTVIGTGEKFYYDAGKQAFIITGKSNWRDANPDIVPISQVVNAEYTMNEKAEEIYKNEETKESYDPKKYEYDYTFTIKITVDSPYFNEISFELKDGDKPEHKGDENFTRHDYDCRMIQHICKPGFYPEPVMHEPQPDIIPLNPETWTCSCGQEGNTGRFCSACGKERVLTWDCPSCGQKGNTGKFCSGCGKEKPAVIKWFCPECGQENTGKFCSACGAKMPDNVKSTEVKKITPLVKKPGMEK